MPDLGSSLCRICSQSSIKEPAGTKDITKSADKSASGVGDITAALSPSFFANASSSTPASGFRLISWTSVLGNSVARATKPDRAVAPDPITTVFIGSETPAKA